MENNTVTQKTINERNKRNGGVELLRILCMFGFVCLHVIGYSSIAPFGSAEVKSKFLLHLRYVLNIGVDVFAFISGFYGIKFSIRKVFILLYIGVFSSICVFLAEIFFFDVEFKIISLVQIFLNNWYFREYLILFLLVPFFNSFFDNIQKEQIKKIILPLGILFIWNFLSTQFPSSFGQSASLGSHSAILLLSIYLLGRVLQKLEFLEKLNTYFLILLFLICLPILFCFSRLKDFSSPFCIIAAICIFELFRRIRIPIFISKFVWFLSPSMLGVLLLHNAGSHQISGGLVHRYFDKCSEELLGMDFMKYSIIIFSGAIIIDLLRRFIMFIISKIKEAILDVRKSEE